MAQISALNIGNQKYDIYASSAISAEILTNTDILVASATSASVAASAADADKLKSSRNIAASGDVTWTVSFNGSKNVTGNATINNVASAISWSGVSAAVDSAIGEKIAGVYTVRGTKTVAQINALSGMKVGDVYNVSDSGKITAGGKEFDVLAGDNIVYTSASTTDKGWDKLAATIDTSTFVKTTDQTYKNTTAYASNWNSTKTDLIASAKSGAAASAWITANSGAYISSSHLANIQTASGYAKNWSNNSANVIGSAKSGMSALNVITANSAQWGAGEVNQNAYSTIKVYPTKGATVQTTNASAKQDVFGLSASDNISMTATSDDNGNPIIAISAKNSTSTAYRYISANAGNVISANSTSDLVKFSGTNGITVSGKNGSTSADVLTFSGVPATSAEDGVTKASYVSENVAYIF